MSWIEPHFRRVALRGRDPGRPAGPAGAQRAALPQKEILRSQRWSNRKRLAQLSQSYRELQEQLRVCVCVLSDPPEEAEYDATSQVRLGGFSGRRSVTGLN